MEEEIFKMCDEVLRYLLSTNGKIMYLKDPNVHQHFGKDKLSKVQQALNQLANESPAYAKESTNHEYTITGYGERFILRNGYKGELERIEKDQLERVEDREYSKSVSKSVLDTNKSIVELNKQTEKTYHVQRTSTVWMAIASVIMAFAMIVQCWIMLSDKKQSTQSEIPNKEPLSKQIQPSQSDKH